MYWGTSCLWMNKHVSVPSISPTPLNRRLISFFIALLLFVLSDTFIRCLYYWYFAVYGKMTAFICLGWIVTSPVVLFMCTQSTPVMCTIVLFGD